MILFVGDKPSKANLSPDVAFVGTKSYKTLIGWIKSMDLNPYHVVLINRTDPWFESKVKEYLDKNYPIITLGLNAKSAVSKITPAFFSMPHPSGLNRQLNRKEYIDTQLTECKKFIQESSNNRSG